MHDVNQKTNKKKSRLYWMPCDENPLDIPNPMVEQEVSMSLMQFEYSMRQQGMDMKQYMQITNKLKKISETI